jgi:hypothetical protein
MALILSMLFLPILLLEFLSASESPVPAPRGIAIRLSGDLASDPDLARYASFARRRYGTELDIGPDEKTVPAGWLVRRVTTFPVSQRFRSLLAGFPVRLEESGFVFDGRTYRSPRDGVQLSRPERPQETLILGNSRDAALRILRSGARRDTPQGGYLVISGDLTKEGRFERSGSRLVIVRSADRDEIAGRESFYRSLESERHNGVLWRFRESERAALAKWQPVLTRFLRGGEKGVAPLTVIFFPDPATKGLYTGSSRPADLVSGGATLTLEMDVSAPPEPDAISPVLAAAALSRGNPRLASRPLVALAAGARAFGRWWGRDVRGFAAFLRAARVEPSVEEVLSPREAGRGFARGGDVSPVLAAGAAASWLEAGARSEGEAAVSRALAGSEKELAATLSRWRKLAGDLPLASPRRRALPPGFQRGVSYAMSNSAEASYASPRSRATLSDIRKMSVNSISVMPYGYSQNASSSEIAFVHLHPAGETDEGTVRAVSDARSLGMTAMVKPQIWLGGGEFVGSVAMRGEEEWRRWFDAYRRFAVHNAIVAEASGAALYCVGTELVGTEGREKEWRQTIAAVRLATGAPLLYASNWAAGAVKVPFWDALDVIGADFYDPLSADPAATDADLREGVRRAALPLSRLSRRHGKPVLFAEAGYPPFKAAWTAPHQEESEKPFAPQDAARAIAAVFDALEGENWWKGVYWWKVFSDGRAGNPKARNFNFLEMPAGEAIAAGFQRLASRS